MKKLNVSYFFIIMFIVNVSCNNGKTEKEASTESANEITEEVTSESTNETDDTSDEDTTTMNDAITIEDTKWVLTELMGQAVEQNDKTPHLTLSSAENTISGNNGCNLYTSSYTLKEGNRLEIGNMANTLMACDNMAMATGFMEMLQKADNYALKDGVLSLNKARMAPLARFEKAE